MTDQWNTADPPDTERLVLVALLRESRAHIARCLWYEDGSYEWHVERDGLRGSLLTDLVLGWQELPGLRLEWLESLLKQESSSRT